MNHVTFPTVTTRGPPSSHTAPSDSEPRPKKQRRISRACDFCHKRSTRCKPSEDDPSRCQNCSDFAINCTYNRPAKKRGIKTGNKQPGGSGSSSVDGEQDARMLLELTNSIHGNGTFNMVNKFSILDRWKTVVLANEGMIRDLMEVYFEVVYPIYPLFHGPSLILKFQNRDYLSDHSFFAETMAICALSSARVKDGALFLGRWDAEHFKSPTSESFFAAVRETMPQDLGAMRGLDWMRTCALMALYGIQVGNIEITHQYLGLYHSLVSMDNLHEEKNWPKSGVVETELRRRLFWSMYTLEVFSSIVWGSVIRCRESQCRVSYPSEVDDGFFSDQAGHHPQDCLHPSAYKDEARIVNPISWLHGWNFNTTLYRILEYAMDDYRRQPNVSEFSRTFGNLLRREKPHQRDVLKRVMETYKQLPARFKESMHMPQSGKLGVKDRISFQAANITATLQLVRMVLFSADEATVEQKCGIARELLDSFTKIPVFFLRAISSPLLHHFAGIGTILGSVMEEPLSEQSYRQVREVLLAMVDLLASLEADFNERTDVGAASRLRNQILAIDNFMSNQRNADFSPLNSNPSSISQSLPHTQTLFASNHGLPNHRTEVKSERHAMSSGSDANIDPSLQAATINSKTSTLSGGMDQTVGGPGSAFGYPANSSSITGMGGMNGMAAVSLAPLSTEGQFQIPPELLEGWPWPFDASSGAGGGAGFGGY